MKSEKCFRCKGNRPAPITNLIVHHSITDIINQTPKFIGILDIVKESLNIPLLHQWIEFLEDVFQFPSGTGLLGLLDPNWLWKV